MNDSELKAYLDAQVKRYNCIDFIENDPISIPHRYTCAHDIEIAGFLAATIAWGQRKSIIKSAKQLMDIMDNEPHDFVLNHTKHELAAIDKFVYRTFNSVDCQYFITSLKNIYTNHGGLHKVFADGFAQTGNMHNTLAQFYNIFFELPHQQRTQKHLANVAKGSAGKRLNMYLRWMVRPADTDVDFGLWTDIPTSALYIPLDVHCGNVARQLGLLKRTQNDWRAVDELTTRLRDFCPEDPVKYDFALFGAGVNKEK